MKVTMEGKGFKLMAINQVKLGADVEQNVGRRGELVLVVSFRLLIENCQAQLKLQLQLQLN